MFIVYPPKGRLLADSCRGPIGFTYVLFWVSKTLEPFQFTDGFLAKKIPEKALLMGRVGRVRRVGRVGRSRKVSFKFLQTLWAFRTCIYILVYKIKIVTNIHMGFKI